jgi:hypothetical protein
MKTSLKVAALALMLGATSIATGQTRDQIFADQVKQYQSLTGTGTYVWKGKPVLRANADDPVAKQSFVQRYAELQVQSANDGSAGVASIQQSPVTASARAADPQGREPFVQRLAELQAESSNSGHFAFQPAANALPASVTAKPAESRTSQTVASGTWSKFFSGNK